MPTAAEIEGMNNCLHASFETGIDYIPPPVKLMPDKPYLTFFLASKIESNQWVQNHKYCVTMQALGVGGRHHSLQSLLPSGGGPQTMFVSKFIS